ncbi:LOW QUALITY PROTEIN: cell adhesion molecule DSCAM-like [Mya arenaria]|uniref:LOW QUALITY PROTEIN: cell adhesion molecule DSCAM-like n=1 Tax=Mya arenaria TaxID=6604 RepID=UPI0022E34E3F|nr:LOW QUALITY PROTEIN: cell adhesion molecule DSCAM-like [Mya arenaria]
MRSQPRDAREGIYVLAFIAVIFCTKTTSGSQSSAPDDGLQGPIFLSEPPVQVVIPNTRGAIVPCTVYGNPAPLVTWETEDGHEVVSIPEVVEVLQNHSLYFRPFSAGDVRPSVHTQVYRCVAQNRVGRVIGRRVSTSAVLVGQLEQFTVSVHDVWVMRGGTAVLQCDINPSFWRDHVNVTSWTHGAQTIKQGGRFSMTPEGELHVRDVRDTDGYTDFRCTATSSVADIERSSPPAKLVIHDPPAGGKSPSIEAYPTQSEAVMGSTVQLACVADGWPLPTYRWSRDGHSLNVSDPRYSQFGGDLVIKGVKLGDGGRYSCNASNPRGSANADRSLNVIAPLSAAIIPGHQVQDSGETAVFNCTISGFPLESVMWYRNGRLLDADERLVFRSQTVLEVRGVGRKDQGMYQCFASGGHTETQAAGQLMLGDARPTILDGYGNQLFKQQGDRASIRCVASGNPTPEVTWLLDGQSLKERSHVSVGNFLGQSGDVYSYVNISHVTLLEGGDYRCVATNRLGLADHVSRLNVYGEPYIREMANITATANERLKIKCYVTGYPIAAVSWYRDGRILPLNHLQQVVNGTLTILNVQKLYDAGRYTCIALDPAGHGTERSVYVSVVEPPVIDPFRIPARKQGDRVTLSCAVSSGDLPIYISWTKDGLPVPPDIGITVETSGPYSSLLKIDDVSPLHDGNYTCHAHNEAARTNYTAILHVDVPPSWVVEPQDTSVIRKDLVTLDCHAVGIPEPRITWSENTGGYPPNYLPLDLSDTDRYRMFPNGTLQIRAAMEEDEGYFLCRADNHIGHGISKIIFLRVHVPARFDISEKNYTVSRGQNVSLECQAIGDKPLSVSWHVRNATLGRGTAGSRYTVSDQNTTRGLLSRLTIHPAARGDTGSFTCNAANKVVDRLGHDSTTIYLTVLEPPDAPVNLTLVERGSRHVVLTWARPFDGNSAITEYIIEYQNNSDDARGPVRNLTTSGEAVTARVEGLHPSFLYDIRIRARNSVGLGLTSHQISTRMLEEAPTGPPTEVKATALGSQQLQVTWKPPALEHRNGIMLGYYVGYRETHTSSQLQVITKDVDPGSPVATDGEVSVVVGNLKKFTEYQVHVRGYNKEGQGPPSQDFAVTTLEDVPSQPPEGVHAYASSSQSIRITWGPPPLFTLHGVLQGYKVLYRPVRTNEDETDASSVQVESLDVDLSGLDRYTNYSVQVLAFTRKGEGVRSNPIYVRTMEDVPGRPAGIKAVPASNVSVAVSWRPPTRMNGVLTTYTIYYCNTSTSAQEMKLDVSPTLSSFLLRDLEPGVDYWVRVTASTRMGEGESTQIVTVAPVNDAPARITSFSLEVVVSFQATVLLPCDAIGDPAPSVTWSARYGVIDTTDRHSVLKNGSLYMVAVIGTDADNYTCRAKNKYGSDVITYSLSVQVDANTKSPPKAPVLSLAAVTSSTIQVNWLSGSNGGSPILGFLLQHRKEHDVWREVHLGARNRTYTASGLLCGIPYKFSITALNSIGRSEQSNVVDTATVGGPPIPPMQDELLRTVNVTSVELDFRSWRRDVCGIHYFSIRYQTWGDNNWVEVNNNVNWNTTTHTVEDLRPATRYVMKVTAYSDAGSAETKLIFATLTYAGSTLEPLYVFRKDEPYFYEKAHIMVPLCVALAIIIAASIALALFCVRRRQIIRYKETSSNIRRDITAETSLMNDLDKRLNCDPGSPADARLHRNVNLLISLHSDDTLSGNNSPWGFHDTSKTTSDNASLERYDDNPDINPYATFNDLKLVFSEPPAYHQADPEYAADSISIQKAQAQKAMQLRSEAVKSSRCAAKLPCPPTSNATAAEAHSYDNQAVMLSPRKYASADQIHALFTMAPPRPQSAYSKNRSQGTRSTPSEKGSQRHSLISSVTTVSSSRDELMEAFENLSRNPPPPVVYETEADSLSQPTDSSSTEPGICLFTESPPQPNERREASCEVPRYESPDSQHYKEPIPPLPRPPEDNFDARTAPRRAARQHCSVQKMKDAPCNNHRQPPQTRGNARPRCIEEVTYMFSGDESPSRARKPTNFDDKLIAVREDRGPSVWRRGGRRTPHARSRYDTTLQTPGSADNKPLVTAQVMATQDETPEDEEAVGLLERYYRPVPSRSGNMLELEDGGDYTENFTVV